jgi:hypothetical protein
MGATAGYVSKSGYRYIHVNGKKRLCLRLAFLWMTGSFPKAQVDHINGVRNDNRWDNLREATRSFNIQNQRRAHSRNRLGVLGVEQVGKRFVSRIWVDNKAEYLGTFDTAEAAHGAYLSAKRKLHPGCTI